MVNGTSADENQVSSTSGSRDSGVMRLPAAAAWRAASSKLRPTNGVPSSAYHAGIWWPHHSCREMHQSWMFSSHWP
ncbi:hypothetical protein D3C83_74040 [compost metagenome]